MTAIKRSFWALQSTFGEREARSFLSPAAAKSAMAVLNRTSGEYYSLIELHLQTGEVFRAEIGQQWGFIVPKTEIDPEDARRVYRDPTITQEQLDERNAAAATRVAEREAAAQRQIEERAARAHGKRRKTAGPGRELKHGTTNAYTNHGCRCDACSEAARAYRASRYVAHPRPQAAPKPPKTRRVRQHGTASMYNGGCRCLLCKDALRAALRKYDNGRRYLPDGDLIRAWLRAQGHEVAVAGPIQLPLLIAYYDAHGQTEKAAATREKAAIRDAKTGPSPMRRWLWANGYAVSRRGQIRAELQQAYYAAMQEELR